MSEFGRSLRHLFVLFAAVALMYVAGHAVLAQSGLAERLKAKGARVETGVKSFAGRGGDPSAILALVEQMKARLEAGDPSAAEALLDRALAMLADSEKALPPAGGPGPSLPVFSGTEEPSDLYGQPEPVVISGYTGSAMEPFISPDGRYLFFNNENDPKVNTDLFFAERVDATRFRFLGELPGVNSPVLDAVASLDGSGHFYFTTVRDYARTRNSIYTGHFDGQHVTNVRPVPGDISPKAPGEINMDASVSPDGQTLYVSRATIFPGAPAPAKSELMIAAWQDGAFRIDPDSARILRNVNRNALEYAPSVTADGLELYFTRASQGSLRIMVATRNSTTEPFGEALFLKSISGFVEAPSVSLDRKELFFHKKVGERFEIYRARRNPG